MKLRLLAPALPALLVALPFVAGTARADLPEPGPDHGSTAVEVEGTRVKAEARARAKAHDVEALVVARLVPAEGNSPSKVATWERWSVDGHERFHRGDRELGREWERAVSRMLDEAEKEAGKDPRRRGGGKHESKSLLERLERALGSAGSRTSAQWVIGWSIGTGRAASDDHDHGATGRVAVVTLSPAPAGSPPTTQSGPGPVTPGAGPATPPALRGQGPGVGSGSAAGSSEGSASSEEGVRQHAVVDVDLARTGTRSPEPTPPSSGPITPRDR